MGEVTDELLAAKAKATNCCAMATKLDRVKEQLEDPAEYELLEKSALDEKFPPHVIVRVMARLGMPVHRETVLRHRQHSKPQS